MPITAVVSDLIQRQVRRAAQRQQTSGGNRARGGGSRVVGSSSGPEIDAEVLATLPTNRLAELLSDALRAPARAPRVRFGQRILEGALELADQYVAEEGRATLEAVRAQVSRSSPEEQARDLERIRINALRDLAQAASLIPGNGPRIHIGGPGDGPTVAARLVGYARKLHEFALETAGRNVEFAGTILELLAERVANAARALASGAGDAFELFWGFRPGEPLKWGGALLALGIAAAVFLLLSPGGQSFLVSYGGGAFHAGKGAGALGVGAGRALAKVF